MSVAESTVEIEWVQGLNGRPLTVDGLLVEHVDDLAELQGQASPPTRR